MAVCFWSLLSGSLLLAVTGKVPKPHNVKMESINLKNILKWDRPLSHTENMTYTAEYALNLTSTPIPLYRTTCLKNHSPECDFSFLSPFGSFFLRVRAEVQNSISDWVTIDFTPLSQTIIGPPRVTVTSRTGFLDVSFTGPMHEFEQTPLQDRYGHSWAYKVLYWRRDDPVPQVSDAVTHQNIETLSDLDPWTTYCLQVQVVVDEYNQTGKLSEVHCEKTTDSGKTPERVIIIAFLASMAVTLVLVTASVFPILYIYRTARYVFFPACSLPQHLKEYLSKPYYSSPFLSPGKQEEKDECCSTCIVALDETETCRQDNTELSDNTAELLQSPQRHLPTEECLHIDHEYSLYCKLNKDSGNATEKES